MAFALQRDQLLFGKLEMSLMNGEERGERSVCEDPSRTMCLASGWASKMGFQDRSAALGTDEVVFQRSAQA